jgi:hypothetical protein
VDNSKHTIAFFSTLSLEIDQAERGVDMGKVNIQDDAGDVPGWVLITLMTAGLVVLIWSIAAPALRGVFEQALAKVASF